MEFCSKSSIQYNDIIYIFKYPALPETVWLLFLLTLKPFEKYTYIFKLLSKLYLQQQNTLKASALRPYLSWPTLSLLLKNIGLAYECKQPRQYLPKLM